MLLVPLSRVTRGDTFGAYAIYLFRRDFLEFWYKENLQSFLNLPSFTRLLVLTLRSALPFPPLPLL